jgi:hypothetical protein
MEKEPLGFSPGNQNVVWKHLLKGTYLRYEEERHSFLAFRDPVAPR